ncbi:hypothetical protein ACHAXR_012107 [Thalassiosira sp. AJA248-18]
MAPQHTSIISLIGAPGSGKGTYGALLASRFNASFASVGDMLRGSMKSNEHLATVLRSGALVDDALVNDAVIQSLENMDNSGKDFVILDGFPRNHAQASLLEKWPVHLKPSLAIQFDIPDDVCVTKLLGRRKCSICNRSFNINGVDTDGFDMPPILPKAGACKVKCNWETDWEKRDDDTADTIKMRMGIYHKETKPVLTYWEQKNRLLRFVPFKGVKDMDKLESLVENRINEVVSK